LEVIRFMRTKGQISLPGHLLDLDRVLSLTEDVFPAWSPHA